MGHMRQSPSGIRHRKAMAAGRLQLAPLSQALSSVLWSQQSYDLYMPRRIPRFNCSIEVGTLLFEQKNYSSQSLLKDWVHL